MHFLPIRMAPQTAQSADRWQIAPLFIIIVPHLATHGSPCCQYLLCVFWNLVTAKLMFFLIDLNVCLQNAFVPLQQSTTVGTFANNIGALRATLSKAADEVPLISADGTPSIVTANSNGIAFSRTPQVTAPRAEYDAPTLFCMRASSCNILCSQEFVSP
jgi:hypothetical protein